MFEVPIKQDFGLNGNQEVDLCFPMKQNFEVL